MCTVTFVARAKGYCLGMNRDEKLARTAGLPPRKFMADECWVISPLEPGGGTWISVNGHGVTFALINWYKVQSKVSKNAVSRGSVVETVNTSFTPIATARMLASLPLKRVNPFRLIGFFPDENRIMEWRWNLKLLDSTEHPWRTQQWISSGYDEAQAQRSRGSVFQESLKQISKTNINWLRGLHGSHHPLMGPFSTCMHRPDAATVSYTEIVVSPREATMRYHSGSLCSRAEWSVIRSTMRNRQDKTA